MGVLNLRAYNEYRANVGTNPENHANFCALVERQLNFLSKSIFADVDKWCKSSNSK